MLAYHDEEWGVPSHDDRHLFEMLTLEGAQAGLSWSTILRKREGYRQRVRRLRPSDGRRLRVSGRRAPPRRPGDRAQPAEGRVDGEQRRARARGAGRAREASTRTSGRSSTASRSSTAGARSPSSRRDRALEGDLEGSQAARLPLRRADGDLRVHADGRHGRRPHGRLLQARVVSETMSARLTSWMAARKVATRSSSSSISGPPRHSS